MNRRLLILITSVVSVHLLFFFFDFKNKQSPPPPKKSIVVRTFVPLSSQQKPRVITKPPVKIEKPKLKTLSKKREILNELKESLTKLEKIVPPENKSLLTLPKNIQSLHLDQVEQTKETHYFVLLAQTLKVELELPEYGDVKLELTVLHTGRVLKLRVLAAASEKNQRYLELNIPKLSLPQFNEDLKNENEHTFTLTFCNEK